MPSSKRMLFSDDSGEETEVQSRKRVPPTTPPSTPLYSHKRRRVTSPPVPVGRPITKGHKQLLEVSSDEELESPFKDNGDPNPFFVDGPDGWGVYPTPVIEINVDKLFLKIGGPHKKNEK